MGAGYSVVRLEGHTHFEEKKRPMESFHGAPVLL